jgi:hypothetical protein
VKSGIGDKVRLPYIDQMHHLIKGRSLERGNSLSCLSWPFEEERPWRNITSTKAVSPSL